MTFFNFHRVCSIVLPGRTNCMRFCHFRHKLESFSNYCLSPVQPRRTISQLRDRVQQVAQIENSKKEDTAWVSPFECCVVITFYPRHASRVYLLRFEFAYLLQLVVYHYGLSDWTASKLRWLIFCRSLLNGNSNLLNKNFRHCNRILNGEIMVCTAIQHQPSGGRKFFVRKPDL